MGFREFGAIHFIPEISGISLYSKMLAVAEARQRDTRKRHAPKADV